MNRFDKLNCERIETLLSAFVSHELPADDAAAVAAHLEGCDACRESLAAFLSLEDVLVARRDEVPAIDAYLPAMAVAPQRRLWVRGIRLVTSVPGVAIMLVMWATFMVTRYTNRMESDAAVKTSLERVTAFAKHGIDVMVAAAGGDAWTLTAVYGALAIGVIVSAGALTMKLVRD